MEDIVNPMLINLMDPIKTVNFRNKQGYELLSKILIKHYKVILTALSKTDRPDQINNALETILRTMGYIKGGGDANKERRFYMDLLYCLDSSKHSGTFIYTDTKVDEIPDDRLGTLSKIVDDPASNKLRRTQTFLVKQRVEPVINEIISTTMRQVLGPIDIQYPSMIIKIQEMYIKIHEPGTDTKIIMPIIEYVIRNSLPKEYLTGNINSTFEKIYKGDYSGVRKTFLQKLNVFDAQNYLDIIKIQTTKPDDYVEKPSIDPRKFATIPGSRKR